MNTRDKSFRIALAAIFLAGILAFAAMKAQGHTRDWRDGLPGAAIELSTEPQPASTVDLGAIERDQSQLASDLRASSSDRMRRAIADTNALLTHLQQTSLPASDVDRELRQALALARRGGCENCSSLLSAALRH